MNQRNTAIRNRDYLMNNYDSIYQKDVKNKQLGRLMDRAYADKSGYSIGYVNGKKVMTVAGTRHHMDWAMNAFDSMTPKKWHVFSNRRAKHLSRIAKREGVDVVAGHSRGAMTVAKMNVPRYKKLGLDGAMIMAPKNKRDMINIYQKQPFDRFLNLGAKRSKGYKYKWDQDQLGRRAYNAALDTAPFWAPEGAEWLEFAPRAKTNKMKAHFVYRN